MTNTVLLHIENSIATITFNKVESMNTLNAIMIEELAKVTNQVLQDATIRAVLLRGAGPLFSAGGDIRYFYENKNQSFVDVRHLVDNLNQSIEALLKMPKPVLACVHGSVAGAGLSIMLAADLVIAESNTKFTTAYSAIGISPDGGLSYTLPRNISLKKAMELIMLSEVFDAPKALSLGIVNYVVPADALAEKTQQLINRLANAPTFAIAQIKRLLNQSQQTSLQMQLNAEAEAFAECYGTQDFRTGIESFLKKTKPEFSGM